MSQDANKIVYTDEMKRFLSSISTINNEGILLLPEKSRALLYGATIYIDFEKNKCEEEFKKWVKQNSIWIQRRNEDLFKTPVAGDGKVAGLINEIISLRNNLPQNIHDVIWEWLMYFVNLANE
jgi:hypothetical protein